MFIIKSNKRRASFELRTIRMIYSLLEENCASGSDSWVSLVFPFNSVMVISGSERSVGHYLSPLGIHTQPQKTREYLLQRLSVVFFYHVWVQSVSKQARNLICVWPRLFHTSFVLKCEPVGFNIVFLSSMIILKVNFCCTPQSALTCKCIIDF